jgi:uncharacterized protein YbaR (Trm112 family)
MAIIKFENEVKAEFNDLPWVEDYHLSLKGAKKDKFMSAYHRIVSGKRVSEKGWIIECSEFKFWVWKSEFNPLEKALAVSQEKEIAVLVSFTLSNKGKYRPHFAVDDEIPALLQEKKEQSFSFCPF